MSILLIRLGRVFGIIYFYTIAYMIVVISILFLTKEREQKK